MNNETIEQYAQILNMAASLIDTLNKRKKDEDVAVVAEELRKIATELLDTQTNEVQKSMSLIQRLISFIKSILK